MINADLNEIENYENLRYIGAAEAFWRHYSFGITTRYPAVLPLRIHLENEQIVLFNENEDISTIVESGPKETELTAFFNYNREHPETHVRYVDFPKKFVWRNKEWNPRKPVQGIFTTLCFLLI